MSLPGPEIDWAAETLRVHNLVSKSIPEKDVEDVVQITMMSAYEGLRKFEGKSAFSTWVHTIARRKVIDYYRRSNDTVVYSSELFDLNAAKLACEMDIVEKLTVDEMFATMSSLRPSYRESLYLRLRVGLGYQEIAEMKRSTYEAARSTYRRAVDEFRELWLFNRNPTVYTYGRLIIEWRLCELATCNKEFKVHLHGKLQRFCTQNHQVIAWKRKIHPPKVFDPRMCMLPGCKVMFMPTRSWSKYCCPEHQLQAKIQRRTLARRARRIEGVGDEPTQALVADPNN